MTSRYKKQVVIFHHCKYSLRQSLPFIVMGRSRTVKCKIREWNSNWELIKTYFWKLLSQWAAKMMYLSLIIVEPHEKLQPKLCNFFPHYTLSELAGMFGLFHLSQMFETRASASLTRAPFSYSNPWQAVSFFANISLGKNTLAYLPRASAMKKKLITLALGVIH